MKRLSAWLFNLGCFLLDRAYALQPEPETYEGPSSERIMARISAWQPSAEDRHIAMQLIPSLMPDAAQLGVYRLHEVDVRVPRLRLGSYVVTVGPQPSA